MLMSTDVASIMLPVSRGLMDRELETMTGVHPNSSGAAGAVRGMKRGDPEPDAQTAAALVDSTGAECKRPRIDGIAEVGQVRKSTPTTNVQLGALIFCYRKNIMQNLAFNGLLSLRPILKSVI